MQSGIIRYWNESKGFGFIEVRDQTEDVFFHISTWQSEGTPKVGTAVSFESERSRKGPRTTRVEFQSSESHSLNSHTPALKIQPKNRSNQVTSTSTSKIKKSWLSSIISALVIMVAFFFGGSELLLPDNSTLQNSKTLDQTISNVGNSSLKNGTGSITGDAQIDSTIALIKQGGPYPYPEKDGSTFYNREGKLPKKSRGYYREYTVPTPGVSHRGARRIVTGGNPPTHYYLTLDHYDSFIKLEVQ